jgi:hypothetical protein
MAKPQETIVVLDKDVELDAIFDSDNLLVNDRMFIPEGGHRAEFQPTESGTLPIKCLEFEDGRKLYLLPVKVFVDLNGSEETIKGEISINSKSSLSEAREQLKKGLKAIHVRAKHANGECYTSLITAKQFKMMGKKATTKTNVSEEEAKKAAEKAAKLAELKRLQEEMEG